MARNDDQSDGRSSELAKTNFKTRGIAVRRIVYLGVPRRCRHRQTEAEWRVSGVCVVVGQSAAIGCADNLGSDLMMRG
jgi:hypothetical protein